MGCDIHIHAEKIGANGDYESIPELTPFDDRIYGVFGFLAGVRNYSRITPISPVRGIPTGASHEVVADYDDWRGDAHSSSWLSVKELLEYDYSQKIEDLRVCKRTPGGWIDCGATGEPGQGKQMLLREFLGEGFMSDLEALKECGADRIVFWFDN